jgi:regulator of protease activity HflC (stomatin/prohibitin superfamily)
MGVSLIGNVDSLIEVFSQVAWVVFAIYAILLTVITVFQRGVIYAFIQLVSFRILVPFLLVAGLGLLSIALVFIPPINVGVVVSVVSPNGVRATPLQSGLHFLIPFVEQAIEYPVYWQNYTMAADPDEGAEFGDDSIRARTRDGQEVFLDTSIVFRIDRAQAVLVHIDWQDRYIEDFVRPVMQGYVRTEVSQFAVDEVNSASRKDLEDTLDRLFREEFASKGFIVDQFLLRDITFSPEYAAAVEAKQVALEEQEAALFEAERERRLARGQADAVEIIAQGDARAIEIEAEAQATAFSQIGAAIAENRDVLTYQYIDRLAPSIQTLLLPSNAPLLLPLDELLNQAQQAQGDGANTSTSEDGSTTAQPTAAPTPALPSAPGVGGGSS